MRTRYAVRARREGRGMSEYDNCGSGSGFDMAALSSQTRQRGPKRRALLEVAKVPPAPGFWLRGKI